MNALMTRSATLLSRVRKFVSDCCAVDKLKSERQAVVTGAVALLLLFLRLFFFIFPAVNSCRS